LPLEEHKVLVYYGVGGIGKTRLLKELGRRLEEQQPEVGWSTLDFATSSHRDVEGALSWLSKEMKRKYKAGFLSFELALLKFWQKSRPHTPLQREEWSLLEEGALVTGAVLTVKDIPFLDAPIRFAMLTAKAHQLFKEWWTKHGQQQLYELEGMTPNDIQERLPMFWAEDLKRFMRRKSRPVALFLDTYEALWEEGRTEATFFDRDEWVRELVAHLPEVLWVVAGREKLRWGELPDDWEGFLEQHLVGQLARSDIRRFLASCGIVEDEIQRSIVEGSAGVPFYLDLAADTYLQIKRSRREPVPEDFGGTQRKLLERFLRHLDQYEIETLKVLSVARYWHRTLFDELIGRFRTGYPATAFLELCRFSFVQEGQSPGTYTIHPLMRASLQEYQDPELRAQVHRYLFDRYTAALRGLDSSTIDESEKMAFAEAFYHGKYALPADEFSGWFTMTADVFNRAGMWRFLIPLHEEFVQIVEGHLGPEHPDTATSLDNLATLYNHQGQYSEAERLYQRALMIREKILGPEHPDTAASLNGLAYLYYDSGRWHEVEPLLERALSIKEKIHGPEHPDTATSLNDLALLYNERARYGEAERLYQRALMIREKILGPEHPDTAETLTNLGTLYLDEGRYGEADAYLNEALALTKKISGHEHPDVARILYFLATLRLAEGQYGEADTFANEALTLWERVSGPQHPYLASSLYLLGSVYRNQGRYEEAEHVLHRALEISENHYGTEDPRTMRNLTELAILYGDMGRYEEAEPMLERALKTQERILSTKHPDTAASLYQFARLRCQQERYEESRLLFRRALGIQEEVLGCEHPATTRTRRALENLTKNREMGAT
jgi:tetratricopeptide (TPR) repeat protein